MSPAATVPVLLALTAAILTLPLTPLAAQGPPSFGLIAGVNSATFGGSGFNAEDEGLEQKRATSFLAGVTMLKPLSPRVSFAPELLYTRKGSSFEISDDSFGGIEGTGKFRISYIEVPLLFRFALPVIGSAQPHVFLGPTLAARISCRTEATVRFLGEVETEESDCDEGLDDDEGMRKTDLGGMIGAGFTIGNLNFSGRYERGLRTLDKSDDNEDITNRVFTFTVGMTLPGRR
jgi:hypothetical protein